MPQYNLPEVSSLPPKDSAEAERRRVVFVTNPRVASLEYMGPMQVFDEARLFLEHYGRPDLAYRVEAVSTEAGPIYGREGLSIRVEKPYHRLRGPIDTLIFQAVDEDDHYLRDEQFIRWVTRMSSRVRRMVSICTGSFILAQAGVLNGKRATTHWCACDDFQRRFPDVTLERDPIYVKDGHIYTSAGATSGMDLAIALVEEDFGAEFARRVAQGLVMYLRRPGNQTQFSVQVGARITEDPTVCQIQAHIAEHLTGDLRVETLAERLHMSPRNFTRVFTREVGMPPGRYVEHCRLEYARQCLEQAHMPISTVAQRAGYATADGMRLAFDRHLGVSPREYRRRFATSDRSTGQRGSAN